MKKKIIFFSILIIVIFFFYLIIRYPSVEILPNSYFFQKQKSFIVSTHRASIYKVDKVMLTKLNGYPKSKELKKRGYHFQNWSKINEIEKTEIIKYLIFLSDNCDKTDIIKLINDLKHNKNLFLFSKIGLFYGGDIKKGIDLSYFYFLNEKTNTLYAFELRPNM